MIVVLKKADNQPVGINIGSIMRVEGGGTKGEVVIATPMGAIPVKGNVGDVSQDINSQILRLKSEAEVAEKS